MTRRCAPLGGRGSLEVEFLRGQPLRSLAVKSEHVPMAPKRASSVTILYLGRAYLLKEVPIFRYIRKEWSCKIPYFSLRDCEAKWYGGEAQHLSLDTLVPPVTEEETVLRIVAKRFLAVRRVNYQGTVEPRRPLHAIVPMIELMDSGRRRRMELESSIYSTELHLKGSRWTELKDTSQSEPSIYGIILSLLDPTAL